MPNGPYRSLFTMPDFRSCGGRNAARRARKPDVWCGPGQASQYRIPKRRRLVTGSKDRGGRRKPGRNDRRRWVSTIAEDIPPGPQGQPAHKAGTKIYVVQIVDWDPYGKVSFPAPRPSALLLEVAGRHASRADRLQKSLPRQMTDRGWMQPVSDHRFTNEEAIFQFFEEAMAA